jgi:hypothetical protein
MLSNEYKVHLIEMYTWHIFGTQIEDQDQAQDKDEV